MPFGMKNPSSIFYRIVVVAFKYFIHKFLEDYFDEWTVIIEDLFSSNKGIIQGFPLSPLLFLLVIEDLSRLIVASKSEGKLRGIKKYAFIFITHLVFVNDVVIFGSGFVKEWAYFSEIVLLLCNTSGMEISVCKSTFF